MKFTNLYHEGHYQQLFQSYSRSIHFFKINDQKSTVKINEACASLHFENGGRRGEGSLSMKQHCKTTFCRTSLSVYRQHSNFEVENYIVQALPYSPVEILLFRNHSSFSFQGVLCSIRKLGWTCQISRNWEISQIFENRENLNFLATGTQCEKHFF